MTMTTRQLNRATLARQMLLARESMTATKAVTRLVAMQAQLARPPFVGLWTRLDKFTRDQLIRAVVKKDVVRATSLRGTIHLMTAVDFVAFRGAIQPGLTKGLQVILRKRLDTFDSDRVMTMARAFFGKAPATFDAFRVHLKKSFPKGDERAMAYAVRLQLPMVQVPGDATWGYDAAADFALADEWLDKGAAGLQEEGAAGPQTGRLVTRYLAAYGPATIADAQTWSGLAGLKETFEALRPSLVTFRDDKKRELFDLPDAPRPGDDAAAPVRFLPEFDTLMLAHADRSRFIADAHRPKLTSKNLQVAAVFLVDGMAAGTWKVERKRKTATLVLQSFAPLPKKAVVSLEAEGNALLRFVEEDAETRAVRIG